MGAKTKAKEISDRFYVGRDSIQMSVLGLLAQKERCGYQIAKDLRATDAALDVPYGALYPLLERMEGDGLIDGRWEEGRGQKGVHVYGITRDGRKALANSKAVWLRVIASMRSLVGARA